MYGRYRSFKFPIINNIIIVMVRTSEVGGRLARLKFNDFCVYGIDTDFFVGLLWKYSRKYVPQLRRLCFWQMGVTRKN
jgi:hypothetical protein